MPEKLKCIIYVRVSDPSQVEGTSLDTQESICRQYAEREGMEVVKLFREEGVSAKMWQRPEFMKALEYLRSQKGKVQHFIMYKIDRISRNLEDQYVILKALRDAKAELRSATENIDDTPAGQLLRNMLWAFADFDNKVRAERCRNGSVARFRQGYWVHTPPPGYLMRRDPSTGRSNLVSDPERAHHIQWMFAQRGLGCSFGEIATGMNKRGYRSRHGKQVKESYVERLITNTVYMGIMKAFGEEMKGKYEPLVTADTWYQAQAVGKQRAHNMPRRAALNPLFPLRRFVYCVECRKNLTGSSPRGNGGQYSYYHHHSPNCSVARNIHKEDLEKVFRERLTTFTPRPEIFNLVKGIILDVWEDQINNHLKDQKTISRTIEGLLQEKANLLEMKRKNPALYTDEEFLQQKAELDNQVQSLTVERRSEEDTNSQYERLVEYAFSFFVNPVERWEELDIISKTEFQRALFPEGLSFNGTEFGTAKISLLLELLQASSVEKSHVVRGVGVEPTFADLQSAA